MKTENYLDKIREEIMSLADGKYREFQVKLLSGINHFVGVRLPRLRKLAKQIAKENGATYLDMALARQPEEELFEEIMLQGMVIGYIKADISDIFSYAERFVPKMDNWSVCDSFCSGFKHAIPHREEVWHWLERFLASEEEFAVRFGIVMLLNYYIDEIYLGRLFAIFDAVRQDGYYVKMAVAWAVSICYVKYPKETMDYLKRNDLDDFTYNKALQKIVESRCVPEQEKKVIRQIKR